MDLAMAALDKGLRVVLRERDGTCLYLKLWCGEIKAIETRGGCYSSETITRVQLAKLLDKYDWRICP